MRARLYRFLVRAVILIIAGPYGFLAAAAGGQQSVPLSGTGGGTPDFSLTVSNGSSSSMTVTAGGTATYSLTLAPLGGMNQSVTLTCAGAPAMASCGVTPSTDTLNGTNSATATAQVTTTSRSTVIGLPEKPIPLWPVAVGLAVGSLAICLWSVLLKGRAKMRLRWSYAGAALLMVIAIGSAACGGTTNGGGGGRGTPAGNYSLTVTGTATSNGATLQHSVTLTLDVN